MIAKCRKLHKYIVDQYVAKREAKGSKDEKKDAGYLYVTPRTLLAIVRLAQALARIFGRNAVVEDDVLEALRLMDVSRASIIDDTKQDQGTSSLCDRAVGMKKTDTTSAIFNIIRELCETSARKKAKLEDVKKVVQERGFKPKDLRTCINSYVSFGVLDENKEEGTVMYVHK